ncbi:MAG: RNA-processing protein [Candidatus Aenigmarchaeota archaeon]|nr:RNA-processing protein [Candidatus Aenigmarchaeota archaeon]
MMGILETLLVPKDRVGVIKDTPVTQRIEKDLGVKLKFDDNLLKITGEDGLNIFQAKTICKAIARGFVPKKAFKLFKEENVLDIVELSGMKDNKIKLIRSRMIGTNGKTRRMIERFSGCSVSVYGKTISIIGKYEQSVIAKEAVNMILRGSKHSKVYGFLQQAKNESSAASKLDQLV